jgi:hypothetical protein
MGYQFKNINGHNYKHFTDLKHQSNIPTHYIEKNNNEDKYVYHLNLLYF